MEIAGATSIDLEVVRGRLQSIVDEAAAALIRTAFAFPIREAKDFSCNILTTDGRTVAQSTQSVPVFLGTVTLTARSLLRDFPLESWQPDDVVGTNDPWIGTGHLQDLTALMPVFVDGSIVAFAAVVAHLPDVGGRVPGSEGTQMFEEGVRIPPMKIATAAGLDTVLVAILAANVRVPEQVLGDVNAILNGGSVIARSLSQLCREISVGRFFEACDELEARTEAFMRRAIAALPDGAYPVAVESAIGSLPFTIKLAVVVSGDEILLDFTGSTKQVPAGINSCYSYTRSYTIFGLKCLLAPALPFNEGILHPISMTAPEGSVVNSRFPAAGTGRNLVGHYLPTLVFDALAEAAPDRIIAESAAPQPMVRVSGLDVDRDALFIAPITVPGGVGARAGKDGLSCLNFPTNIENVSIEMQEAACPLLFEEQEFLVDSAGAGQFQGGFGQRMTVRCLTEAAQGAVMAQRLRHPPEGVHGGESGSITRVLANGADVPDPSRAVVLAYGDTITIESAGGGGFGRPDRRSRTQVEQDVRRGCVSMEKAARVYGYRPD